MAMLMLMAMLMAMLLTLWVHGRSSFLVWGCGLWACWMVPLRLLSFGF
jgi:hypothetical protein